MCQPFDSTQVAANLHPVADGLERAIHNARNDPCGKGPPDVARCGRHRERTPLFVVLTTR
jgi:hypothetical protein